MPKKDADANPSPPQPTTQELLAEQIDRACRSGKYLILSVRVDGDRVWCERVSRNFPIAGPTGWPASAWISCLTARLNESLQTAPSGGTSALCRVGLPLDAQNDPTKK